MTTTIQQITDQLNAYDAAHTDDPQANIWQDVIFKADWYDADATDARYGVGDSVHLITTDGVTIAYSLGAYSGTAHSPHAAGWYAIS
jgi:hypothetical protein